MASRYDMYGRPTGRSRKGGRGTYKVRILPVKYHDIFNMSRFPNFSKTGSVSGMREYYGRDALLVQCGSYIYNVTSEPEIYWNWAH